MDIGQLLKRDAVAVRVSANSKRQALTSLAEAAARSLSLDADEVLDALLEREQQGSTGVGQGVAVPHARLEGLVSRSRLTGGEPWVLWNITSTYNLPNPSG